MAQQNSKLPSWIQERKKLLIILALIVGCFLSTLNTIALTKRAASLAAISSLFNKSTVEDYFPIAPYDSFDQFDDWYDYVDGLDSFSLT